MLAEWADCNPGFLYKNYCSVLYRFLKFVNVTLKHLVQFIHVLSLFVLGTLCHKEFNQPTNFNISCSGSSTSRQHADILKISRWYYIQDKLISCGWSKLHGWQSGKRDILWISKSYRRPTYMTFWTVFEWLQNFEWLIIF